LLTGKVFQKNMKNLIKDIIKEELLLEEKVINFDTPNNNFVVVAGGPGAGKSFITRNLINLNNVKEFNVDQVRVMTAKKLWGDEWEKNISTEEGYQEILNKTYTTSDPRNLTVRFLKQFLQQERNEGVNVIYDAGGGQKEVMEDVWRLAKDSGFNTTLIYVRTPLELAKIRNNERPRSLPDDMVAQYHQKVKDNMRNMIPIFDNVWTVDNKELIDLSDRPSDNIEKIK
jgi:predicted kinase